MKLDFMGRCLKLTRMHKFQTEEAWKWMKEGTCFVTKTFENKKLQWYRHVQCILSKPW